MNIISVGLMFLTIIATLTNFGITTTFQMLSQHVKTLNKQQIYELNQIKYFRLFVCSFIALSMSYLVFKY
ncbi:MAG: hypothetical protein ACKOWN_05355, partial [Microbacteriaceae bacterium]